jgi:hypothetical protein
VVTGNDDAAGSIEQPELALVRVCDLLALHDCDWQAPTADLIDDWWRWVTA